MGRIVLALKSTLPFGKYQGQGVKRILQVDHTYLRWVHYNLKYVVLLEDTRKALNLPLSKQMLSARTY